MKAKMNCSSFGVAGCGSSSADRTVELNEGEFLIVPHGVEHRTAADDEAEVILFEPAATPNTGSAEKSEFTAPTGVRI